MKRTTVICIILILVVLNLCDSHVVTFRSGEWLRLPHFWTNVGFSPAAPLPLNNTQVAEVLLSTDVQRNLEIIAALPNDAIASVRIHWMLSLIRVKASGGYDYSQLDVLLGRLHENRLAPVIEMMTNLITDDFRSNWAELTIRILERYTDHYPLEYTSQWQFETWNEPDLRTFNILNMTKTDYFEYITGIADGLHHHSQRTNATKHLLRGPAGLFKSHDKHRLCWGILDKCNANIDLCPLDTITYHRKGHTSIDDILIGTIELLRSIHSDYPKLRRLPYANSEADPTAGWSTQHEAYADVRYANMLIRTVFQHWNAMYNQILPNLNSISHDNAFLSYYPFEYEQRTLLARFIMNNTTPSHVQFVRKPVHAALGLLGSMAHLASLVQNIKSKMQCLTSIGEDYGAVLCISADDQQSKGAVQQVIRVDASALLKDESTAAYFVEYLANEWTDPYFVWQQCGRPSFPNRTVFARMREAEGPLALHHTENVPVNGIISVSFTLKEPWTILLRICTPAAALPQRITDLRIRKVNDHTILLLWNEPAYRLNDRCVRSYEIFYSKIAFSGLNGYHTEHQQKWINIAVGVHLPFMSYHRSCDPSSCSLHGLYKVRAVDIFNRTGPFSKATFYFE